MVVYGYSVEEGRKKEEGKRIWWCMGGEWRPAAARAHNTEIPASRIRQELQPHTPHQFPRVAHVVARRQKGGTHRRALHINISPQN